MYLDFFKLKELPFRLTADRRFYFLGTAQELAKAQIRNGLAEAQGCMLLSADAGVGKTLLIQDLLAAIPARYLVVQIRHPEMSITEFLQAVLAQLDEPTPATARAELLANLDDCLARQAAMHRIVVLVVDNGELLSPELLDEILGLPVRRSAGERNLRVILAARTPLEKVIAQSREQGRPSRVSLHIKLAPLKDADTRRYLEHRLSIAAGKPAQIFEDDAFVEFQRYTGGVPRLLNILADAALMLAFNRSRDRVNAIDVRSAVDQLQWVEFYSRASLPELPVEPVLEVEPVAQVQAGIAHISVEYESEIVADLDLPMGKLTIGRAKSNDICIDSQYISRHHCQVLTTPQFSVIEDLQSQNGILVRSRRVSVHRLQDGDEVLVGEHRLIFSRMDRSERGEITMVPRVPQALADVTDAAQTRLLRSSSDLRDAAEEEVD